jgi:two-component system, chemotaxis family, sensor kinase CheA
MSDRHPQFDSSFMDDYFAEADEHLLTIRRTLLSFDGAQTPDLSSSVLEELFRSCHSLKGISAMVELREVELLAHHMESCLRAIREGKATLNATNLETLLEGANALEAVIVSRREGGAPPPGDSAIEAPRALADTQTEARPASSPKAAAIEGERVWKVQFVPSPELVERGVKIDTIRARLLRIGTPSMPNSVEFLLWPSPDMPHPMT